MSDEPNFKPDTSRLVNQKLQDEIGAASTAIMQAMAQAREQWMTRWMKRIMPPDIFNLAEAKSPSGLATIRKWMEDNKLVLEQDGYGANRLVLGGKVLGELLLEIEGTEVRAMARDLTTPPENEPNQDNAAQN